MSTDLRIISIGALACHPLRGEQGDRRPAHATTSLIRTDDATVLVDPGLPAEVLVPRLSERAGVKPEDVTHVFLTDLRPDRRRGIEAFPEAQWLASERERDNYRAALGVHAEETEQEPEYTQMLETESALLSRIGVAPDSIAPGIDLFPLPGVTPGCCGLLLPTPRSTILICGDAVATTEHLEEGKVLPHVADLEAAAESFREAMEIADILVLGRDNIVLSPFKRMGM